MLRPISTLPLSKSAILELGKSGCLYVEDLADIRNSEKYKKIAESVPATVSALDLWQDELRRDYLTTFCDALDTILEGGFSCGGIVEICGAHGSGKTQICMQTSVATRLPKECGGLGGQTLYIDTRNGFSSTRIQDIIIGCQKLFPNVRLNVDELLRGINVVSPQTVNELRSVIHNLENHFFIESKIRAVIIDSLSLPVQCSLADGSRRTQFYFRALDELQRIATKHNVAVLIVNELRSHIDSKGEIVYASAGGQQVAHRAQKRLVVARLDDTTFAARILKASTMPQISVEFQITEDGIRTGNCAESIAAVSVTDYEKHTRKRKRSLSEKSSALPRVAK